MQISSLNPLAFVDNIHKNKDLTELLQKVSSGNAILFTGAGFSSGTTNIVGKEPPFAKRLAELIAERGGFDGEGDLKFSANYFIRTNEQRILIDLLKEQYTLKDIDESHKQICSASWRKIYTTNYDNSIELSLRANGLSGECITLSDSPKDYFKKKNICVHINGNIGSLKGEELPESFKLSTSSYLSPDSFMNSEWYYPFRKDLEQASAIVFAGYSLYDIDIQKILFESPHFKNKTYFITHGDETTKALFELSEFGTVYTIGIDGFAKEIKEKMPQKVEQKFWLESFVQYTINPNSNELQDKDVLAFLLHGTLSSVYVSEAITGKQKLPYMIVRKDIEQVADLLKESNFVTVLSDFGNGKSVFLDQLAAYLTANGKLVYVLNELDGDYIEDVEKIISQNTQAYLIIDNYESCLDLVQYILVQNQKNIKVILSTRSSNQVHLYEDLVLPTNSKELSIDILSSEEIEMFSKILENTALWGDKAGLSREKKADIIRMDNRGQISNTLLHILNAPQMKNRIAELLSNVLGSQDSKDTVLAICILEVMNQPLTFSNISEVAMNNKIYDSSFTKNTSFLQLFPSEQSRIVSKSSLFARNLLKNHFKGIEIVNKLLDIVEKFQPFRDSRDMRSEIYKSLLKFSFIARTLPDDTRTQMLIRYYEQLKIRIDRLDRTPHFWLQYAMARIAIDDFPNAQNCLDTAYAKAYEDYDTCYLDAQQSRLWIQLARRELDQNKSISYFEDAHKLLRRLDDDQYKFRQIETYQDYYNDKYHLLSNANKKKFLSFVKEIHEKLEGLRKGYFTETNRVDYCYEKLDFILNATSFVSK